MSCLFPGFERSTPTSWETTVKSCGLVYPSVPILGTVLVILAGCSDLLGPSGLRISLETDRDVYHARFVSDPEEAVDLNVPSGTYSFEVEVVIRNTGSRTLFLSTCEQGGPLIFGVRAEEEGTPTRSAFNRAWTCTAGGDGFIRLEPGERRIDTFILFGPVSRDMMTGEIIGAMEGLKRIGFEAATCTPSETRCRLPPDAIRSKLFRVELVPAP